MPFCIDHEQVGHCCLLLHITSAALKSLCKQEHGTSPLQDSFLVSSPVLGSFPTQAGITIEGAILAFAGYNPFDLGEEDEKDLTLWSFRHSNQCKHLTRACVCRRRSWVPGVLLGPQDTSVKWSSESGSPDLNLTPSLTTAASQCSLPSHRTWKTTHANSKWAHQRNANRTV